MNMRYLPILCLFLLLSPAVLPGQTPPKRTPRPVPRQATAATPEDKLIQDAQNLTSQGDHAGAMAKVKEYRAAVKGKTLPPHMIDRADQVEYYIAQNRFYRSNGGWPPSNDAINAAKELEAPARAYLETLKKQMQQNQSNVSPQHAMSMLAQVQQVHALLARAYSRVGRFDDAEAEIVKAGELFKASKLNFDEEMTVHYSDRAGNPTPRKMKVSRAYGVMTDRELLAQRIESAQQRLERDKSPASKEAARKLYEQFCKQYPADPAVFGYLEKQMELDGKVDTDALAKVLDATTDRTNWQWLKAEMQLGIQLMQRGKTHDAIFRFEDVLKNSSNYPEYYKSQLYQQLGHAYGQIGKKDESSKYYRMAQEIMDGFQGKPVLKKLDRPAYMNNPNRGALIRNLAIGHAVVFGGIAIIVIVRRRRAASAG